MRGPRGTEEAHESDPICTPTALVANQTLARVVQSQTIRPGEKKRDAANETLASHDRLLRNAMNVTTNPSRAVRLCVKKSHLHLPVMRGVIERRMLLNFRCNPLVLSRILPPPFHPKLLNGWGMAGICLIRLSGLRPAFMPALGGFSSENAAHRIAVEWNDGGALQEGVFIPRRDTDSLLNRIAGGRLFPGIHHAAAFRVWETGARYKLKMLSHDSQTFVRVLARVAEALPPGSVFSSLAEASEFFRRGALGWSARSQAGAFDGLELRCDHWHMTPMVVERVESSFFSDSSLFPPGSVTFDSAFLMDDLEHEWHARGRLLALEGLS